MILVQFIARHKLEIRELETASSAIFYDLFK